MRWRCRMLATAAAAAAAVGSHGAVVAQQSDIGGAPRALLCACARKAHGALPLTGLRLIYPHTSMLLHVLTNWYGRCYWPLAGQVAGRVLVRPQRPSTSRIGHRSRARASNCAHQSAPSSATERTLSSLVVGL